MSVGDGAHIIASQTVFESLHHRERYLHSFRSLSAMVKHGVNLDVYQFIESGHPGLSTALPGRFVPPTPMLRRFQAYVLAHALKHEAFFAAHPPGGQMRSAANALLYFLARDSEHLASQTPEFIKEPDTYRAGKASLEEQFGYYMSLEFPVCNAVSELALQEFRGQSDCLQHRNFLCFVSEVGKARLKSTFPEVWRAFGLEEEAAKPSVKAATAEERS